MAVFLTIFNYSLCIKTLNYLENDLKIEAIHFFRLKTFYYVIMQSIIL